MLLLSNQSYACKWCTVNQSQVQFFNKNEKFVCNKSMLLLIKLPQSYVCKWCTVNQSQVQFFNTNKQFVCRYQNKCDLLHHFLKNTKALELEKMHNVKLNRESVNDESTLERNQVFNQ